MPLSDPARSLVHTSQAKVKHEGRKTHGAQTGTTPPAAALEEVETTGSDARRNSTYSPSYDNVKGAQQMNRTESHATMYERQEG